MTRSLLQFVGSTSAVVWATLLMGSLFSMSASAGSSAPVGAATSPCTDCYACNAAKTGCDYKPNAAPVGTCSGDNATCKPNTDRPANCICS